MIAEKKINYIDNIKSRLMAKKYTYQFVPKRLRNVIKNQIKIQRNLKSIFKA